MVSGKTGWRQSSTAASLCIPSNSLTETIAFLLHPSQSDRQLQLVAVVEEYGIKKSMIQEGEIDADTCCHVRGPAKMEQYVEKAIFSLWFSLKAYFTMILKGRKRKVCNEGEEVSVWVEGYWGDCIFTEMVKIKFHPSSLHFQQRGWY